MIKYIVNENFHGYEKLDISSLEEVTKPNNEIVIIVDESHNDSLVQHYKFVREALKHNNRVILLSLNDDNKLFRPLTTLMITFQAYDIYQIESKEVLSKDYISRLEDRKPDYSEVQTYIGGDLTAFSDIDILLFGIESLVEEGNINALSNFIEEHIESIESLTSAVNIMKKTYDMFNSNELIEKINSLKDDISDLNNNVAYKDKEISDIKYERDEYKVSTETLKRENEKLKSKVETGSDSQDSPKIKSFKTTSIQLLPNNKTKIVLYFKEISYVKYVNTLVKVLVQRLKLKKLKVKLLIYDTDSEMCSMYNPLRVVDGNTYVMDKNKIIKSDDEVVITEPSTMIIEDILTSDEAFDVVIIYDRTHSLNDIVDGNLVTKFFVLNSSSDYKSLKDQLKINDVSNIITNTLNSININNEWQVSGQRNFIDIPEIPEFKRNSINSKSFVQSKYGKQATSSGELLLDTIIKKSKINTLYNN